MSERSPLRIGFVVNDLAREMPTYTTTAMAMEAQHRGHEVWHIPLENFAYRPNEHLEARAHMGPASSADREAWIGSLQRSASECLDVTSLDVLFLRNNPAEDAPRRSWAEHVVVSLGHLAVQRGVFVVNDPVGLSRALDKLYLQSFPEEVRPRSLISRDRAEILAFVEAEKEVVMKPLQGSGGTNVFLAREEDGANLNQMIDAVRRDGYVLVQEFLPEAEAGDIRLILMNGRPLQHEGQYAAIRRRRSGKDLRSNVHAGGTVEKGEVDEKMLRVAEAVRPKLVADGMFLVGLDMVGAKLLEINVFSPGGLVGATRLEGVQFAEQIIESLERKVEVRRSYGPRFDNAELATL